MSHQDSSNKPTAATGTILLSPEVAKKHIPNTFKMGRDTHTQLKEVKHSLFEKQESGEIKISGLYGIVTKMDFTAFGIAVSQVLCNQSYQCGNTDTNSGLSQEIAKKISKEMGTTMYVGDIEVSLKDLCRYGYGETEPNTKQKKSMATIIKTLDKTPVIIKYPNGDIRESKLCATMDRTIRAKDGAVIYNLHLAPIFCNSAVRNFGELPQDIMKRTKANSKRLTEAHYELIEILGEQMNGSSFIRYIDDKVGGFVDELGLLDSYKAQRVRTEKQLLSLFETMKCARLITDYKVEYKTHGSKKHMNKVAFQIATKQQMLDAPTDTEG